MSPGQGKVVGCFQGFKRERCHFKFNAPHVVLDYVHFCDQKLIPYRYSSCCSFCCSVISNQIGMKLGRIVFKVNTHRLTESDC